MDWHDVHLVRAEFLSLLSSMGVLPIKGPETNASGNENTTKTGMPGRPTSKHLVLQMAQRRLEGGNIPGTLTAFSEELAEALRIEHSEAAPATPKTIRNAIRKLWHSHKKPPKSAGSSGI
jgi:hypothetical protein